MRQLFEPLEGRTLFSGPFSIGDPVAMLASGVNVRAAAAGTVVGSQNTGQGGVVTGGPVVKALSGTTYTWYAVNWNTGADGWSADAYIGPVAPAAPKLVSPGAATSPGPVLTTLSPTLSWSAVAGAKDYGVYVKDATTDTLVFNDDSVGNVTSVTIPALTPGHAYRWNARASNRAGSGGFSSLLYFQAPPAVTTPQPPAGVAATDGAFTDKVRVTWAAPAGASAYEVWRATTNSSAAAVKISAADVVGTSFDDATGTAGVTYFYFVKAKNSAGASGFSAGDAGSRASTPTPTPTVYQAESAVISGGTKATKYAGYTGSGYVDYGGSGTYVQFSVARPAAGNAKLAFRYANGTTLNQTLTFRINGADIVRLPIAPTGSWTTWKTVTFTAPLKAGTNAIRATAAGNGGPDLDSLTVSAGAPNLKLNHVTFLSKYTSVYGALNSSQTSGLNQLLSFIEADGTITDVRWAAYMLATVKLECANRWQPIEEFGKGAGHPYGEIDPATGFAYYGRGYVQLTWAGNYQRLGAALGVDLYHNPSLALRADIAYKIMTYGMKMGTFTGVGFAWYLNDTTTDYVNARRIINGTNVASTIAGYATKIEAMLTASKTA